MKYKEVEAKRRRENLAEFICENVISEDFGIDGYNSMRKYIGRSESDALVDAFCDYLELGNWFYEAMVLCDFDIERFMDALEMKLIADEKEAVRNRAEIENDYLRMVGAK